MTPPWMPVARSYTGVAEIKGTKHNPLIVNMFASIKATWFRDDETPWCAAFVGSVLEQCGIQSTRSAAALSYQDFGVPVTEPVEGAIAYMERRNKHGRLIGGHVAFVNSQLPNGDLLLLGGNQNDTICLAPYKRSRIKGYRFVRGFDPTFCSLPVSLDDGNVISYPARET